MQRGAKEHAYTFNEAFVVVAGLTWSVSWHSACGVPWWCNHFSGLPYEFDTVRRHALKIAVPKIRIVFHFLLDPLLPPSPALTAALLLLLHCLSSSASYHIIQVHQGSTSNKVVECWPWRWGWWGHVYTYQRSNLSFPSLFYNLLYHSQVLCYVILNEERWYWIKDTKLCRRSIPMWSKG